MSTTSAPDSNSKPPNIFRHHGRDLLLEPGKPLYAYALRKDPAPRFPQRSQPYADQSHGGWGKPVFVTSNSDYENDEEDGGGWGEPIARYGGDGNEEEDEGKEVEKREADPPGSFMSGYINEYGNPVGDIDMVWAFDGVPSWDGVKYNPLSQESRLLLREIAAVNARVPSEDWPTYDQYGRPSNTGKGVHTSAGTNQGPAISRPLEGQFNCRVHGAACPCLGSIYEIRMAGVGDSSGVKKDSDEA